MLENRLQTLQKWMKTEDIAYTFVKGKANLFYLTGFRCEPHERLVSLLVFQESEPILVCPNMEKDLVRQSGWNYHIIGYSDNENPWELLSHYFASLSLQGTKIAIEKGLLSVARSEQLQNLSPALDFISCEDELMNLRLIKSKDELAILREAAKLADYGVEVGIHALATGRTEMDVLALIEYELKRKGIAEMSFGTLVLSGEQSANPHGKPSMKQIRHGEFVLFDLGVVLEGYCSDITRTVAFGQLTEEQRAIYDTVLSAQLKTLDICKAGTILGDLDLKARSIITSAGYGDYFPHRIGHGLGTEVHELPSLNETNQDYLKVGMTFTIEPGIYVPGLGGVRIEDDVLITTEGYECLTTYPKELQIIT
ncbi:Xaa-Pro peptidase family protein [Alkalihalobacillus sp. MEB130]|uniref:M24 family metallopeptidase n=1 Tax=Alkalihalobacillus sp. MEB130 TaxID=2976704 RepID=UPI0028DE2C54|nr:Xaa-Pro peptidase family protein [Alkalihalobacillus sp. MEB130]MDT8859400.1 Xaa-Pro peptidase family protein [Alkalihalobacillus sp. MEB130]